MSTILSLAAVLVCGISTLSWFQLNRPDNTTNLVTASPSINIDSINGYKVEQQLDRNGDAVTYDGNSPTVTKRKSDDSLSFENAGNTESDLSFDIPSNGVGYYLIKKNSTTGLFKYSNAGTEHFAEYQPSTDSLVSKGYVSSIDLTATDVLRVKHYDFKKVNNKVTTVDEQVVIESAEGANASIVDGDVSIGTEGTYKVWFDYYYKTLTLEKVIYTVAEFNNTNVTNNIKKAAAPTKQSKFGRIYFNIYNFQAFANDGAKFWVHIWDGSGHTFDKKQADSTDASYVYYFDISSIKDWTPTNLQFTRTASDATSPYQSGKCWNTVQNATFSTTKNQYDLVYADPWNNSYVNINNTIRNSGTAYEQYTNGYYYIKSSSMTSDVNDGTLFYSGNLPTSSLSVTFARNEYFKVFQLDGYKRLYPFLSFSGTNSWMNPHGKLSSNASGNITETGNEGYCQASYACIVSFVFNASYEYVFTLSSYTVSYVAKYFITYTDKDDELAEEQLAFTEVASDTVATGYTLGSAYAGGANLKAPIPETTSKRDDVNGIYYKFDIFKNDGNIVYYNNATCTTEYSSTTLAANKTIYLKYVTSETAYNRIYLDVSKTWATAETDGSRWQSVRIYGASQADLLVNAVSLGNNLYRAFIHNSKTSITATNGLSSFSNNDNNWSDNFSISNDNCYFIRPYNGAHRPIITCTLKSTSAGEAWIWINGIKTQKMNLGDGTNNKFVYENGFDIDSGKTIKVTMTVNASTTTFDDEDNYANKSACTTYLNITDSAITTKISGKFNFYINGSNELSIAMVPEKGNGFYIMNYSSTTNSYVGAIKMYGSTNYATYNGFYASSSTRIYIKSYLNAVDKLYDNLDSVRSSASVSIQDDDDSAADYGVITFSSPGYYNIEVSNDTITIKGYTFSDFFKLDPLNTKVVDEDDYQDVWNQLTSLILEVEFTCNTPVPMNIDLIVDNPLSDYVGVGLFVKASTALSNPYEDMRGATYGASGNHYNLSSGSVISPQSTFTTTVGVTKYYAYIIIDYLPVVVIDDLPSTVNDSLSFYLRATQA